MERMSAMEGPLRDALEDFVAAKLVAQQTDRHFETIPSTPFFPSDVRRAVRRLSLPPPRTTCSRSGGRWLQGGGSPAGPPVPHRDPLLLYHYTTISAVSTERRVTGAGAGSNVITLHGSLAHDTVAAVTRGAGRSPRPAATEE
ncbi:hypothetical protein EVAR_81762_1 [Eumeta japonica]|uniref:Uncharacterized protein n=1 Tax=Eumeta variegata TaxID=151549 RepID=A0A4C1UIA0_EUMVA|nr:hypothetical protein EVAR_81762_1 [Eumeta japonica]